MTRNIEASPHTFEDKVVHVEDLEKLCGYPLQAKLEFSIAYELFRAFNRGRFALDVGEDVGDFWNVASHLGFQFGDLVMRVLEGHALVEFHVLLYVKLTCQILDADVMHI